MCSYDASMMHPLPKNPEHIGGGSWGMETIGVFFDAIIFEVCTLASDAQTILNAARSRMLRVSYGVMKGV